MQKRSGGRSGDVDSQTILKVKFAASTIWRSGVIIVSLNWRLRLKLRDDIEF
jgi:hypothetical protein